MNPIPTLTTERLILRAPQESDLEAEVAFYASERSAHVGGPVPRDQVWRMLATFLGHWALRGYGFWGIQDRETGAYLGRAGLWFPEGWPEREIGWALMAGAEGRGIAKEAALAAREYAYKVLNWETTISLIAPSNTRSIALAERLGARYEKNFDHARFGKSLIYRHPSPEGLK